MVDVDRFFDKIDANRVQRVRELSALRDFLYQDVDADPFSLRAQSAIVLSYAHWEGFYNDCVEAYISCLRSIGVSAYELGPELLVGIFGPDFQSLVDRKNSLTAQIDFMEKVDREWHSDFTNFDLKTVSARSNLDWAKFVLNNRLLKCDISALVRHRIKIDRELVGWRHAVAHGNSPDLSGVDVGNHIKFASDRMLDFSDNIQARILDHI